MYSAEGNEKLNLCASRNTEAGARVIDTGERRLLNHSHSSSSSNDDGKVSIELTPRTKWLLELSDMSSTTSVEARSVLSKPRSRDEWTSGAICGRFHGRRRLWPLG